MFTLKDQRCWIVRFDEKTQHSPSSVSGTVLLVPHKLRTNWRRSRRRVKTREVWSRLRSTLFLGVCGVDERDGPRTNGQQRSLGVRPSTFLRAQLFLSGLSSRQLAANQESRTQMGQNTTLAHHLL
ncbi:hypothetical protein AGIG_G20920 [Arapaima gigas]